MSPITNIVVSRYYRNVDFVYRINNGIDINVMIYDKENYKNPYNIPVNKGNEASVYLKYIIDYYDCLTDFTFFIHDEEYAWHHSGSIIDKYTEAVSSKQMYYNINDKCRWDIQNSLSQESYTQLFKWYNEYIEEYIPISKVPNHTDFIYGYQGSAQFLVHKDLIQNLPKDFYVKLYNWIITTELSNRVSGMLLEWTWHVFWVIYPTYIKNDSCVNTTKLSSYDGIPSPENPPSPSFVPHSRFVAEYASENKSGSFITQKPTPSTSFTHHTGVIETPSEIRPFSDNNIQYTYTFATINNKYIVNSSIPEETRNEFRR
jgi:hypothetical protein